MCLPTITYYCTRHFCTLPHMVSSSKYTHILYVVMHRCRHGLHTKLYIHKDDKWDPKRALFWLQKQIKSLYKLYSFPHLVTMTLYWLASIYLPCLFHRKFRMLFQVITYYLLLLPNSGHFISFLQKQLLSKPFSLHSSPQKIIQHIKYCSHGPKSGYDSFEILQVVISHGCRFFFLSSHWISVFATVLNVYSGII